jgi:hypothetical protein
MKTVQSENVVDFTDLGNQKRKRIKTPEDVRYSTYEITYLMAGRMTAFAGIATSEAVPRNEKKEWLLRKPSVWWCRRRTTGGTITSTGI